jgi:hypothetical protein
MNNEGYEDFTEKPKHDEHEHEHEHEAEAERDEREPELAEHDEPEQNEHESESESESGSEAENDWRAEADADGSPEAATEATETPYEREGAETPYGEREATETSYEPESASVPYESDEPGLPEGELADLPHYATDTVDTTATADLTETGPAYDTLTEGVAGTDPDPDRDRAASPTTPTTLTTPADASEPLLTSTSAEAFLERWSEVQGTFIEDPHKSVTEAEALLTEVLTAYQEAVEQRREQISSAWDGDAADTEKMRLALLDYRAVITTMLPAQSNGGTAF